MGEWYIRIDGKIDKSKKYIGSSADEVLRIWREKHPALRSKVAVAVPLGDGSMSSTKSKKPSKASKSGPMPSSASLSDLIEAAKAHGEASEPDMEVGDLHEVLGTCWEVMTPAQRKAVFAAHRDLVREWLA